MKILLCFLALASTALADEDSLRAEIAELRTELASQEQRIVRLETSISVLLAGDHLERKIESYENDPQAIEVHPE